MTRFIAHFDTAYDYALQFTITHSHIYLTNIMFLWLILLLHAHIQGIPSLVFDLSLLF
jgi:hypothetical protein